MKWPKKTGASQPNQLSDTPSSEILVAATPSDHPLEKSVPRVLFSICTNVFNNNDFEAFLASLVLKSLLLPNDVNCLRANKQVWDDLSNLHLNTKKLQDDWADEEKGIEGREMDDYIPMELLEGLFEPVMSTDVLREFAEESGENWVLLHVVMAPLRKICIGVIAKLRTSGRAFFDEDGGLVVTPFVAEMRRRGGLISIDASSILKGAGRAGLLWAEKQDRESVAALVKDGLSLLEKVRK